jgi:hypothetical protein
LTWRNALDGEASPAGRLRWRRLYGGGKTMERELTYHVPFERLIKLGRSAGRKVYPSIQWLTWLWIALLIPAWAFLYSYSEEINDVADDEGIPFATEMLIIAVGLVFLVGILVLRRYRVRLMKSRANFDQIVRLKQDDGGLHVITDDIEYYLKWRGLTQMLIERDGVVVSHGNLFFLVPDKAFASAAERLSFIRDVYGRLSESAQALSAKYVRPVLAAAEKRAAA